MTKETRGVLYLLGWQITSMWTFIGLWEVAQAAPLHMHHGPALTAAMLVCGLPISMLNLCFWYQLDESLENRGAYNWVRGSWKWLRQQS